MRRRLDRTVYSMFKRANSICCGWQGVSSVLSTQARDAVDHIRETMGVVVHGIDFPIVAGMEVGGMADAVNHRVAHVDIGRCHIDFGTQNMAAVRMFAGDHFVE